MKLRTLLLVFFLCFAVTAEAKVGNYNKSRSTNSKVKKEDIIRSEIGLNIPQWGLAIDAIFDPRLDDIVPGYHIVNLVLTNRRGEAILFDVTRDRWIVTDNTGKKHTAQNHVKYFDKKMWDEFPEKLKGMLDYPSKVNPGKSITIDVFLPKSVDLFNFKEVVWKSASLGKEFNIFTSYEDSLSINDKGGNEFELPKVGTKYEDTDATTIQTPDETELPETLPQPEFDPTLDDTVKP